MLELVIPPVQSGKGRSFQATLLAHVNADALWAGGGTATEVTRPVWMMLGGSDNELRPFVANLQTGRKADHPGGSKYQGTSRFEVLKSAGYHYAWQRTPVGTAVTIFLPDLFRLDPGMVDPKGIQFCLLPSRDWVTPPDPQAEAFLAKLKVPTEDPAVLHALTLAPLFIAYLDRRTRCPLIPDPRFYALVLVQALTKGLASWSVNDHFGSRNWGEHRELSYREHSTTNVGYARGLVFKSTHEEFEAFLAEQVKLFFAQVDRG